MRQNWWEGKGCGTESFLLAVYFWSVPETKREIFWAHVEMENFGPAMEQLWAEWAELA